MSEVTIYALLDPDSDEIRVPSLKILEEHLSAAEGNTRERHWIAYWREHGATLLNCDYASRSKLSRPPAPIIPASPGLRRILKNHGITTYQEFRQRTGFSRQHAWNLWHGYTGVGKGTARRLEDLLGIPYDELMRVRPVPASKRYRRPPPPEGEA